MTPAAGPVMSDRQVCSIRESTGRVNVWEGSIRSGKTIASLLRWLMFVANAPRGGELVVIARTRDSAARNVFGPLQDPALFGTVADQVHYTSGAPTARILDRTVHVIGASDAKAEKVIRGMTVAGAYVDELTVIPEEFFTQLLGRMSVLGARLFATTNPDSPAHWLKAKFLDRLGSLPDWRSWHFRLTDNPGLSADYVTSISAEFTGLWYRRFILGEWVAAEGAIYSMWDPDRHVIPWAETPPIGRLLAVGIDYGTTNATAALMLGITTEPRPRLVLVDEWRHDPALAHRHLTDGQISAALRDWLAAEHLPRGDRPAAEPEPEWIVVDPSAASLKVQLHNDRVRGVVDADNDVAYGIRTMATLLGEHRLVVTDRCPGFANEAPGYSWDPKATEKGEDKPLKVADHSLDGGRYAVVTTEAVWRPRLALAA